MPIPEHPQPISHERKLAASRWKLGDLETKIFNAEAELTRLRAEWADELAKYGQLLNEG